MYIQRQILNNSQNIKAFYAKTDQQNYLTFIAIILSINFQTLNNIKKHIASFKIHQYNRDNNGSFK